MSLESLERGAGATVGVAAGAALLYKAWASRSREARIARIPEGGMEQSLVPFYQVVPGIMEACGIEEYVSSGGLAKKALKDPDTEFDPAAREYVVTNPKSDTIAKSTLYRPGEGTRVDLDFRIYKLWVDGEVVDADAEYAREGSALDGEGSIKGERQAKMQKLLNERANEIGFPLGPEVSQFFFEEQFGKFRPWHYATRTEYDADSGYEELFATTGQYLEYPRHDLWTCIVDIPGYDEIRIPTDAPVVHLGRTMTRPLVERTRDRRDVDDAVLNIRAKGYGDEMLGEQWAEFERFRRWLDTVFSESNVFDRFDNGAVAEGLNMLFAKYVGIPLAPKIESSEIGAVIRDPSHPIGKISAKIMGA